jgi:predicted N-formylglutamate amidohydrolase
MDKLATEKKSDEAAVYQILRAGGTSPILFVCDHASRKIPEPYGNLGLSDDLLRRHIAWDIGAARLTEKLSAALDAPAVLAAFSRLLIDPNREEDAPCLIPEVSDSVTIPGNQHVDAAERQHRVDHYYKPFHAAVARMIEGFKERRVVPLVIGVHSFTPVMNDKARPWHAGLLWDKDRRLAQALMTSLRARPGLVVGDNEPYSGQALFHSMQVHGAAFGFPQVTIEIRQDEIDHDEGVDKWAAILSDELRSIVDLPEMQAIRHY